MPKSENINLNVGVHEDPPWMNAIKGGVAITAGEEIDEFTDDDIIDVETVE